MIPTIYIITYNEELLLPFTISFYRNRFPECRIVIYDNQSTDRTVKIAAESQCEVVSFDTGRQISDLKYQEIKNNCFKEASTDWVLVCDCDELLNITQNQLIWENELASSIIRSEGYNMVNINNDLNIPNMTFGYRDKEVKAFGDKPLLFNKSKISKMNYIIGAHMARPKGEVKYSGRKYRLYHYRYINPDYLVERYKMYESRLSKENRENNWGGQYTNTELTIRTQFEEFRKISKKLF